GPGRRTVIRSRSSARLQWHPKRRVPDADQAGMRAALEEARRAAARNEVPIGAVVMHDGAVVARAHNAAVARRDPTAHAELLAVQQALQHLRARSLPYRALYVTLEPCAQCAGAIVLAKLGRLVFGAYDDK